MKIKRLPLLAALAVPMGAAMPALADNGMSYSYVEAAYIDTEIEVGSTDVDGDGIGLTGSAALNDTVFLTASYGTQDFDFGIDLDQWSVGVGAHTPLSDSVDLVGSISYVDAEVDTSFGSADDDGYLLTAGVRAQVAPNVELEGGISFIDLDESGDETALVFGGRYYFTEQFAVGAGVSIADDTTGWNIGARLEF